jgi:tetratricopeptide (TPR) repeat protein
MSRHVGLIIGVNHYQDDTLRPLQFAENDAKALAQWLVNNQGGKWSPPDVQLVQGQHATRELIESLITQLCTKGIQSEDSVLIYFAGHAFLDEKTGDGYLALANTRHQDATTGLSLRSLVQHIFAQSHATQILCILDVFQAGHLWNMRCSSPFDMKPLLGLPLLNTLQHQQNRLLLCSCRGNNTAPETGARNLGTFAHSMIVGMCGPASDASTGNVTLPKLHAYLLNVLGEQHRPQLFGQQQLPLVLVGQPSLPDVPPEINNHNTPMATPQPAPIFAPKAGGLLKFKATPQTTIATQTPPPSSQEPSTSGHIFAPALEEHRQQQCKDLLAQAQQFFRSQNYGTAFEIVEKALQMQPNDTTALLLKGQLLGTAGHFQEALTVIEQILQTDPNNAMAWSMRAVALNNMGQHQLALTAIERSLELDPDPNSQRERYAIKATIMTKLTGKQGSNYSPSPQSLSKKVHENPHALFIGVGLHLLGLLCGIAGTGLLIFSPLPTPIGLLVASLGLAVLCISATHGAFRYGLSRLVLTLFICLVIGGILGVTYKLGFTRIMNSLSTDKTPTRLLQFLFFAIWMIAAATTPLVLAIGGFFSGLIVRNQKHI